MTIKKLDAIGFVGATGDRAQTFPALQAMVQRGHFKEPFIGVVKTERPPEEKAP